TSGNALEPFEPIGGPSEGFHLLGEGEPDLSPAAFGFEVEAAPGNRGEADLADHAVRETDVILGKPRDVGHDVVGAVGRVSLEAGSVEDLEHEVAPLLVRRQQVDVV